MPVVVRFSDFTGLPNIPDTEVKANPRGFAIKFLMAWYPESAADQSAPHHPGHAADADPRGGQDRSLSPSPHGRTLMIVFPLRRPVGLRAATASSRVATVPMFVRSRPSRTRCQAVLPAMKDRPYGRIVAVASTAGLKGYAYVSAYSAAKHAVVGLVRSLALELAHTNVTVNAVCPGFTDTDLVSVSIDNIMKKTGRSREQAVAELAKHNPQGRLVTPEEVADTVLFLCGEGASAITGQAIAVAGGEV